MQGDFFGDKKCPVCGKRFVALYPQLWAYKGGPKKDKFICSWKCLQKYNEPKTKGDHIEMETGERKEKTSRRETMEKAMEAMKEGKKPVECMVELGYSEPEDAWAKTKYWAKKNAPELYEQIPMEYRVRQGQKKIRTEAGVDYTLVPPAAEVSTVEKVPEVKKEKALEVAAVYSRVLPGRTYRKTAEGVALCGVDGAIILDVMGWIQFQGEIAQMILQLTMDGAEE